MRNMFNASKQPQCKMPKDLRVVLVTAYSVWADYFCEGCKNFKLPTTVTPLLVTDENRQQVLEQVFELEADVVVVSSPGFLGSEIGFVEALRSLDSNARVVIFCSNYLDFAQK